MLTDYEYIGWFSKDPFDTNITPYFVKGTIKATSIQGAFDGASHKLDELETAHERMNWYVRNVRKV